VSIITALLIMLGEKIAFMIQIMTQNYNIKACKYNTHLRVNSGFRKCVLSGFSETLLYFTFMGPNLPGYLIYSGTTIGTDPSSTTYTHYGHIPVWQDSSTKPGSKTSLCALSYPWSL